MHILWMSKSLGRGRRPFELDDGLPATYNRSPDRPRIGYQSLLEATVRKGHHSRVCFAAAMAAGTLTLRAGIIVLG